MGEYAIYNGEQIKIGTCEDMYYLRADQAHLVKPLSGNVNAARDEGLRFRFPFPNEDGTEPGAFEPFERGLALRGLKVPEGCEHYNVQFTAKGYNVSLPCPEGPGHAITEAAGFKVHRNGFSGAVQIVQQKRMDGKLMLVCRCGGCGALWRVETLKDAEEYIVAARQTADNARDESERKFWHTVADRIAAGYAQH